MNEDNLNLNKDDLRTENLMLKIENEALKSKDKNNLVTLEMYKKIMEENIELKEKLREYEPDDYYNYLEEDDINDEENSDDENDKIWDLAISLYQVLRKQPNFLELLKDTLSVDDINKLEYSTNLRDFLKQDFPSFQYAEFKVSGFPNKIKPNSRIKCKMCVSPVKPKWPIRIPAKRTNVTPNDTPKILILPSNTPTDITNAYKQTM